MTDATGAAGVAEALWGTPVRPARTPARDGHLARRPTHAPPITLRVLITHGGGGLKRRHVRSRREQAAALVVLVDCGASVCAACDPPRRPRVCTGGEPRRIGRVGCAQSTWQSGRPIE